MGNTYGVYGLDNQPWRSNYHDHLCQCPGCRPMDQDDYEFLLSQFQPVPVVMEDAIIHNSDHPFCADETCPCHADDALFDEYIGRHVLAGTLKIWQAQALLWPER